MIAHEASVRLNVLGECGICADDAVVATASSVGPLPEHVSNCWPVLPHVALDGFVHHIKVRVAGACGNNSTDVIHSSDTKYWHPINARQFRRACSERDGASQRTGDGIGVPFLRSQSAAEFAKHTRNPHALAVCNVVLDPLLAEAEVEGVPIELQVQKSTWASGSGIICQRNAVELVHTQQVEVTRHAQHAMRQNCLHVHLLACMYSGSCSAKSQGVNSR